MTHLIRMTYAFYSILIICAALAAFYFRFEKHKQRARRLVLIAVMTALSVLGRFVFAVIPAFKPVTAVTIISAIWLGPECGFLVGSLSALISNFYFGQGPWTPFQMFALGLLGLFAALLSAPLKKSCIALSAYAAFAAIFYSCVMDIWTVLWFSEGFAPSLYLAAIVSALPHMLLYAASNIIFLLLLGRPFGAKLQRIITKYDI